MNKVKQQTGQQPPRMQSYRLKAETIDALEDLTNSVNKKLNISLSRTAILELIITTAARKGDDWIISLLKNKD